MSTGTDGGRQRQGKLQLTGKGTTGYREMTEVNEKNREQINHQMCEHKT